MQYLDSLTTRILKGRMVFQNGLRWRIGNGIQVQIYKSYWIPRPETFRVISPPTLPMEVKVSEMIDQNNMWKESIIQQHFLPDDAEKILKIPLPKAPSLDQPLWHYDKSKNYSVKSGYQVALKMKFPTGPSSSSSNYAP